MAYLSELDILKNLLLKFLVRDFLISKNEINKKFTDFS